VPQGWESYKGKPIFYSLGNFYFDGESDHPLWNKGIAVSLIFEEKDLVNFEVIGIEKTKQGVTINREETFKIHLKHLNDALEEPIYSDKIQELATLLWNQYYRSYYDMALQGINSDVSLRKVMSTFIKRLLFRNKVQINTALLLHNIRIESHRWIVERVLEEKNKI
jgi:poly-gamma-glutamate synthesis protein (capsule biosynthesis protein)